MTRIDLTFDYVDPGSYLTDRIVDRFLSEHGESVAVRFRPLELRTPTMPHLDPRDPDWSQMTARIASEASRIGCPFEIPAFVPWTRKAHELALHARERGCFSTVHQSIFHAHFVRGSDIGRVDELVELAAESGLDPSEVGTVLGVDRFLPEIEEWRDRAFGDRLDGVPTVEIETPGGRRRLEGFESAEALMAFLMI